MVGATYIRISGTAGVIAGESGVWIPVSSLDLSTSNTGAGSRASGLLSFTLANDDAIATTLNRLHDTDTGFTIEVATYDTSTASATSAGTLLSYAVSTGALGQTRAVSAGTQAASYGLLLRNVSQTNFPNGVASSSAFNYANNSAVAVTPTPADVVSGASVAISTSVAPAPATLTYYAQFVTSSGDYLTNLVGQNWFAVSNVAGGAAQTTTSAGSSSRVSFDPLSFVLNDQSALQQLFTSEARSGALTVHLEALTGTGSAQRVVDNTTYSTSQVASIDQAGNVSFGSAAYYSQHYSQAGRVTAFGYSQITNQPTTSPSAIAASIPSGISAGQPTDKVLLVISDKDTQGSVTVISGDTEVPSDAGTQVLVRKGTSSFALEEAKYTFSMTTNIGSETNANGVTGSLLNVVGNSQPFAETVDAYFFTGTAERTYQLVNFSQDILTSTARFADIKPVAINIDLISGQHQSIVDYNYITQNSRYMAKTDHTPLNLAVQTGQDSASVGATAAPSNSAFIQFRDATGNVVQSSAGQQWFSIATATTGALANANSKISLTSLDFSLSQNAITATLDSRLVDGGTLTAEVASYGSDGTLKIDYVLGSGTVTSHGYMPATSGQSFSLKPTTFQETFYSSGSVTSSLAYDTRSQTAGTPSTINAPSTMLAAASPPQRVDTFVQFVGKNGTALTGNNGSSWFSISGTSGGLSAPNSAGAVQLQPLVLSLGDDPVALQLDGNYLSGAGLSQINVATYNSADRSFSGYQRYTAATVSNVSSDNGGAGHNYTFSYNAYGERIAGGTLQSDGTATAGTGATAPSLIDETSLVNIRSSTAPSLSSLSYVAELQSSRGGAEVFAGTSSGFVSLKNFSIALSATAAGSAMFTVDAAQAAALAKQLNTGIVSRFEIAGMTTATDARSTMC